MEKLEQLRKWVKESESTVFMGGAGVSTMSGIPDFRSAYGLYRERQQGISYEQMLSHSYFVRHTEEFYDFFRRVMLYPEAKPNDAHFALARLEAAGKLRAVVTQNIDGLHQKAGSKKVIELHGNAGRYFCISCGKGFSMETITQSDGVPRCSCGGLIRPDVVLYEESLKESDLEEASRLISKAQLLLVGGTSLVVYPAAGLIRYLGPEARLVILNQDETPFDSEADLVFHEDLCGVLKALCGA